MSATRLLVLGVVRAYGKAHGYLVRSELVSWSADEWANVKWGSIYHSLKQLAKEGLLKASESPDSPGRVDYEMTETGEAEFFRLLRAALRGPDQSPDFLGAGVAFMTALSRHEVIELLLARIADLEADLTETRAELDRKASWSAPQHIHELLNLWIHAADGNLQWAKGVVTRLRQGEYVMAGEGDPCPN